MALKILVFAARTARNIVFSFDCASVVQIRQLLMKQAMTFLIREVKLIKSTLLLAKKQYFRSLTNETASLWHMSKC